MENHQHHQDKPQAQKVQKSIEPEHHHTAANPPMNHAGHDHHTMMIADFRKRFYIVLVLTIPIILLSPMIQ